MRPIREILITTIAIVATYSGVGLAQPSESPGTFSHRTLQPPGGSQRSFLPGVSLEIINNTTLRGLVQDALRRQGTSKPVEIPGLSPELQALARQIQRELIQQAEQADADPADSNRRANDSEPQDPFAPPRRPEQRPSDLRSTARWPEPPSPPHNDKQWSTDVMPSDKWLELLEPFLEDEVMQVLSRAAMRPTGGENDTADFSSSASSGRRQSQSWNRLGDIANLQRQGWKSTDPGIASSARKQSEAKDRSRAWGGATEKALVESFIEAIDATGTDWMKDVAEQTGKRRGSSWWRDMNRRASRKIRTWNRNLNQQSRVISRSIANVKQNGQEAQLPAAPPAKVSGVALGAMLVLVTSVVGFFVFWNTDNNKQDSAVALTAGLSRRTKISDADSLLRACHTLTHAQFGGQSCFWHHRQLFGRLAEARIDRAELIRQLAQLYEKTRYAPRGRELSDTELNRAERIVTQLQEDGGSVVS